MPGVKSSTENAFPLYTFEALSSEGREILGSGKERDYAALPFHNFLKEAALKMDRTRPLHTRSIEHTPLSYKPSIKAVLLSAFTFLGTIAGMYFVRKAFGDSNPIKLAPSTGLDISYNHGMVSARAMPIALPLENQAVPIGSSFQVDHEFFAQAEGGFILQNIVQRPNWLNWRVNPIVSNFTTPGNASWVQVIGATAYVADGSSGLTIIDISTPNRPTLIATYKTPGQALQVQVVGTTAYVADGSSGLAIINIAQPNKPTLIGIYNTSNCSYAVQVVGTTAYVADGGNGLKIIDVTTPTRPTLIGNYITSGVANAVQVVGATAYVLTGSGLKIINITMPSHPNLIGNYPTYNTASGFEVVGTTAYVLIPDRYSYLEIINMTNSSFPNVIGECFIDGNAYGIQVLGDTAYVAYYKAGGGGVAVINNTMPPNLIWTYNTYGHAVRVQVVGTTAYVAKRNDGLQILSGFNRLRLSGNQTFERGNYHVILQGITNAGAISTSFQLNIGELLAPVYQNPISIQKATVNTNYNYIMPDNVFVDPNGYEMRYKAKDLPQWLTFNAENRTFSGKPTPGDTGMFADRSTIVNVVANDGKFETAGQFVVTVSGESYLVKAIKIGLPILSGLGIMHSGYKNRALFLNLIAKRKWRNNQMSVRLGEHFMYELKTKAKDVRKVQAYVRDMGWFGTMSEKILCGKERYIELASSLPTWMEYNSDVNVVYSIRHLEEIDFLGYRKIQIRVLGSGSVIKELLKLTLEGDVPTLDNTYNLAAREERIGLLLFPPTNTENCIEMDEMTQMLVEQRM